MPLLLMLLILLVFPVLELWLLVTLAYHYGWWLFLYLLLVGMVGWQLIKDEQLLLPLRMISSLRNSASHGHPLLAMMAGFKHLMAGVLLMIPGILSDAIAVLILFWPDAASKSADHAAFSGREAAGAWAEEPDKSNRQTEHAGTQTSQHAVIEGEFKRED